jgi:hypothetical protein
MPVYGCSPINTGVTSYEINSKLVVEKLAENFQ